MLLVSEWHWSFAIYLWTMRLWSLQLISYLQGYYVEDAYAVTKFAIYLGIYQRLSKNTLQQATCGYRVLYVCPNLSPSGCYVYMLYNPMLNRWPIAKPDNLFQSQLTSFVTAHAVHVYQVLVWPARPDFSAVGGRKEKLGLDVLVECYRRIKQKHYTKVKSVMQKSPYFVFPVSVHSISIICTLP